VGEVTQIMHVLLFVRATLDSSSLSVSAEVVCGALLVDQGDHLLFIRQVIDI
jgi:hypothetical protein